MLSVRYRNLLLPVEAGIVVAVKDIDDYTTTILSILYYN